MLYGRQQRVCSKIEVARKLTNPINPSIRILMFLSYTNIICTLKTLKAERRSLTNMAYSTSKGSCRMRWVRKSEVSTQLKLSEP